MNEEELREVIKDIVLDIAPEAEFDGLNPDDGLREQLDLDSMDFLNVVIGLHETLGIEIPESDYPKLYSLNGAIKYLRESTA